MAGPTRAGVGIALKKEDGWKRLCRQVSTKLSKVEPPSGGGHGKLVSGASGEEIIYLEEESPSIDRFG